MISYKRSQKLIAKSQRQNHKLPSSERNRYVSTEHAYYGITIIVYFYIIVIVRYCDVSGIYVIECLHLQQELEDTTSKPLSDTNDEEEKPRNQSIAQIVYAENRVSNIQQIGFID